MDTPTLAPEPVEPRLAATAKAVSDLDALVQAVLSSVPTFKPWQRQLRRHLCEADRLIQVLRLVIAMDRSQQEVAQAAAELMTAMRAANTYVNAGRADMGTKAAVLLGFNLAEKVVAGVGK